MADCQRIAQEYGPDATVEFNSGLRNSDTAFQITPC